MVWYWVDTQRRRSGRWKRLKLERLPYRFIGKTNLAKFLVNYQFDYSIPPLSTTIRLPVDAETMAATSRQHGASIVGSVQISGGSIEFHQLIGARGSWWPSKQTVCLGSSSLAQRVPARVSELFPQPGNLDRKLSKGWSLGGNSLPALLSFMLNLWNWIFDDCITGLLDSGRLWGKN